MNLTYRLTNKANREEAVGAVFAVPDGFVCTIREPKRSTAQNDRMWALLTDVARSRPLSREHIPEVWKALFMHACGHEQLFLMGLDGNPFPAGFRSSQLTKPQMADLQTFIEAWGSENGVRWSQ